MSDTLDVNAVRSQITHLEGWGKWDELEVKLMRKMFLTLDEEIDLLKAFIHEQGTDIVRYEARVQELEYQRKWCYSSDEVQVFVDRYRTALKSAQYELRRSDVDVIEIGRIVDAALEHSNSSESGDTMCKQGVGDGT